MIPPIAAFIFVTFFYALTSSYLICFVKGRLPTPGGLVQNYVIGKSNKPINPRLLTGTRARLLSLVFIILLIMLSLFLVDENTLIINSIYSNMISILAGLFLGWMHDKLTMKLV
jgi:hypothetical protein